MGSFGYIFIRDGFRSDTLGRWVCIFFAAPLDARRGKGGHVCSRYRTDLRLGVSTRWSRSPKYQPCILQPWVGQQGP